VALPGALVPQVRRLGVDWDARRDRSIVEYREQQWVGCSAERLFATIADVERYPEFLPGWREVHIESRTGHNMAVQQTVVLGPFECRFASEAVLDPPRRLKVMSRQAPFTLLDVDWRIVAHGMEACTMSLAVSAEFVFTPAGRLLGRLLSPAARSLMDLFAERAMRSAKS
jgi:coenzyme Q-binding protein COQ10